MKNPSFKFRFRPAILTVVFRQFLRLTCLISAEVAPATDHIGIEQLVVGGLQASSKFKDEIVGGRENISDIDLRPRQQPCPLCVIWSILPNYCLTESPPPPGVD